jgi:hypothetical protein
MSSYSQIEPGKENRKVSKAITTDLHIPAYFSKICILPYMWILPFLPHACLTCLRRNEMKIQKPGRILDT